MAIYGSILLEKNNYDFNSFDVFVENTVNEMNKIFDQAEIFHCIKEDMEQTGLSIPSNASDKYKDLEPEKVKKTLLEKVKELYNKFVTWIKESWKKFYEGMNQFYMEHNMVDSFLSKWKDKVNGNNLQKCREKGWQGIPTSIVQIENIASLKDSNLFFKAEEYSQKVGMLPDKIFDAKSYEEAEKIYQTFSDNIKQFNKLKSETSDSVLINNDVNNMIHGQNSNPFFTLPYGADKNKYYFPQPKCIANVKLLAENGQKEIKQLNANTKMSIDAFKLEKRVASDNFKDFSKAVKEDPDNENYKIHKLYYKAKLEAIVHYIKVCQANLKAVLGVLKQQRSIAVKHYTLYIAAIEKYKVA